MDVWQARQLPVRNWRGWDGLALIQRAATTLINEPAVTGGNPIMAGDNPIFEDLLGTSLGTAANGRFQANELTAFGEPVNASSDNFFTGKPFIGELGYAFLFRNYRPTQGKWQTQDPITLATLLPDYKPLSENGKRNLGYPDGWNNLAYVNNHVTMYIDWQGGEWVLINTPAVIPAYTTSTVSTDPVNGPGGVGLKWSIITTEIYWVPGATTHTGWSDNPSPGQVWTSETVWTKITLVTTRFVGRDTAQNIIDIAPATVTRTTGGTINRIVRSKWE